MWIYHLKELTEIPDKMFGYVYLITNLINGYKYVGKKNFYFIKIRRTKLKKRRIKVPSDWKTYWSSSETLKSDVKKLGESNFKREILYLCATKRDMSYLELREQMDRRVLESKYYYNEFIYYKGRKRKNELEN